MATLIEIRWTYATDDPYQRIVITQRQDGPFAGDVIGGQGHYYLSKEVLHRGEWMHAPGSTQGAFKTLGRAKYSAGIEI